MALRQLMLKKKIDEKQKELTALREKDAEFEKREADLEKSIDEAGTDEERTAVEEEIGSFESDKTAHEEAKASLEEEVNGLENELREIEETDERQDKEPAKVEREDTKMEVVERKHGYDVIMQRDDVKEWLGEIRTSIKEKRALTNVGLTIPEVFLGLLRENVTKYSKLYKHVTVRAINGTGREVVMGSVPEAIWTECCATLNELSLGFNDVEVDCYKVGGYFKICNASLEDSDVQLASTIIEALGQAIGFALDKAILYGRNSSSNMKMPQGIVSRLVQTSEPSTYPPTARTWEDLHEKNIKTILCTVIGVLLVVVVYCSVTCPVHFLASTGSTCLSPSEFRRSA